MGYAKISQMVGDEVTVPDETEQVDTSRFYTRNDLTRQTDEASQLDETDGDVEAAGATCPSCGVKLELFVAPEELSEGEIPGEVDAAPELPGELLDESDESDEETLTPDERLPV